MTNIKNDEFPRVSFSEIVDLIYDFVDSFASGTLPFHWAISLGYPRSGHRPIPLEKSVSIFDIPYTCCIQELQNLPGSTVKTGQMSNHRTPSSSCSKMFFVCVST